MSCHRNRIGLTEYIGEEELLPTRLSNFFFPVRYAGITTTQQ